MAAGKRTYTVPADGWLHAAICLKGTVGTHMSFTTQTAWTALAPIFAGVGNTGLTGTCPSPCISAGTGNVVPYTAIS